MRVDIYGTPPYIIESLGVGIIDKPEDLLRL